MALLGFWLAHALTVKRERRKEAGEICEQIEELAEKALESALAGWGAAIGAERTSATYRAKWDAQKLGLAVTRLHNKTSDAFHTGINLIEAAATFRTALFDDPTEDFFDSSRASIGGKEAALHGAMSTFIARANQLRDIVLR
ncbi:hypothetical protein [Sphingomonas sp. OTU376]|uniref:hypothetical protein n=1 Tax=Sphingomonas sp. OTU376 TaxID=3043863 RepID=UPI00313D825C